ncbi:hypothetical protein ACFWBX_36325, partial [Streptomyces sp. NPDC059991]
RTPPPPSAHRPWPEHPRPPSRPRVARPRVARRLAPAAPADYERIVVTTRDTLVRAKADIPEA